jgi:trans-aconitate methyltransferase
MIIMGLWYTSIKFIPMDDFFEKAVDSHQYDNLDWTRVRTEESPLTLFYNDLLRKEVENLSGKNVVDVGCGVGSLYPIITELGAQTVTGIEPSIKNIEAASVHYPLFTITQSTLEEYTVNTRFDVAFVSFVFEHIQDVGLGLERLKALLSPKGTAYVLILDSKYAFTSRDGYTIETHDLGNNVFSVKTNRKSGVMYDVVRPIEMYIEKATSTGFDVLKHIPLVPSKELMDAEERFRNFSGIVFAHLLILKVADRKSV